MNNKNLLLKTPQFFIQYTEALLDWRWWVDKADKLLRASNILALQIQDYWKVIINNTKEGRYNKGRVPPHIPPSNLHDPYFILISYALENLLKTLIIRDRNDEIRSRFTQTGGWPELIRDYDLVKLSQKANLEIDITKENILTRFSRFSKWKIDIQYRLKYLIYRIS